VARRYLSRRRRDEGERRNRITRGGRIAGSRPDKRLAEKAPDAKSKIKLTRFFGGPKAAGIVLSLFVGAALREPTKSEHNGGKENNRTDQCAKYD
jgi:hypothetical protein